MNLVLLSLLYLAFLFGLAAGVERWAWARRLANHPAAFALALGVYCTAWTFYGSLGKASTDGWSFLSIYLGPTLLMPLWWVVMRKLNRIVRSQGMASLADVLSARYGKSSTLGIFVTLGCLFGITPYLALQIKAIEESSALLGGWDEQNLGNFLGDAAFYYTLLIALFIIVFGLRRIEANEERPGMMAGIAFESLFKLLAFLTLGFWGIYGLFGSWSNMQIALGPNLLRYEDPGDLFELKGFLENLLSGLAFWLLPRQFHLAVVEQRQESQLRTALWLVPLYFLLINLFVMPLALAAGHKLANWQGDPDLLILALPLGENQIGLSFLVFLGGFSAATSMMIVSATSLSIMLTNNLILPFALRRGWLRIKRNEWSPILLNMRRGAVLLIMLLAYFYYQVATEKRSLVNIGLNSFVAVAQFAPALLLGLYWKTASRKAVLWGLSLGFGLWFMLLIVPVMAEGPLSIFLPNLLFNAQGIYWPLQWFLLPELGAVASTFFWSMLFNAGAIVLLSPRSKRSVEELRQAELFVEVFKYVQIEDNRLIQTKGVALMPDLRSLLLRFLGKQRTEQALERYARQQGIDLHTEQATPQTVAFAERLLTGAIGASSAQILLSSVLKQEQIGLPELMALLEESQQILELNRQLKYQSQQLQKAKTALLQANENLLRAHQLKDEFLYTVTHELRTPLTSIRAFSEMLQDDPDMPVEDRQHFLGLMTEELERLSRLITTVLDLEKYEAGNQVLDLELLDFAALVQSCCEAVSPLFQQRNLSCEFNARPGSCWTLGDADKLRQVLHNLLGNAAKYANTSISISLYTIEGRVRLKISDDGPGIPEADKAKIFDKFYQIRPSGRGRSKGSGLGLAISQKIVVLHGGRIWVEDRQPQGSRFCISLPAPPAKKPKAFEA